jgi:hypothetical protein
VNKKIFGAVSAAAMVLAGSIAAGPAMADPPYRPNNNQNQSVQDRKNLMRNLGIGLGAVAAYEAIRGHGTNALILGAGAGLAGMQYEKDRKQQVKNDDWRYDGYRDDRWRDNRRDNNRWDNDRRDNNRWDARRDGRDGRYDRDARYSRNDRFDRNR